MTNLLIEKYKTELGSVDFSLISSSNTKMEYKKPFVVEVETASHRINIRSAEILNYKISEFLQVKTFKFWLIKITKHNSHLDSLEFKVSLSNPKSELKWSPDDGERLCAIQLRNSSTQIHIGTEEPDFSDVRFGESKAIDFGLSTTILNLKASEERKLFYVIAENPIRPSIQHPNQIDESTWYCVSQNFNNLEEIFKREYGS